MRYADGKGQQEASKWNGAHRAEIIRQTIVEEANGRSPRPLAGGCHPCPLSDGCHPCPSRPSCPSCGTSRNLGHHGSSSSCRTSQRSCPRSKRGSLQCLPCSSPCRHLPCGTSRNLGHHGSSSSCRTLRNLPSFFPLVVWSCRALPRLCPSRKRCTWH